MNIRITLLSFFVLFLVACSENKVPPPPSNPYIELGSSITAESFSVMAGEVKRKVEEGGTLKALRYCNLNAYKITDSLMRKHNVRLRRSSLKYRNPYNVPTEVEDSILRAWEQTIVDGGIPEAIVQENEREAYYYEPIYVNKFCLQCHGKVGQDIEPQIFNDILAIYNHDLAIGYVEGNLRGLWSVRFKK